MAIRRRESGRLESEVLAALWAGEFPLTVGEVVDALDADLAYNTVQTTLARLHAKGAVQRELQGRAYAYSPLLDDAALAARRMREMLDRGGDHAVVLSRFLGTLSTEDERTLADLLDRTGSGPEDA